MDMDDWGTIDLVLKQFGMKWSDQWSGDKPSYIGEMIGGATDDELVELGQHFGMDVGAVGPTALIEPPSCWDEGKLRVFVSHLTAHKAEAATLQQCLGFRGMSCFVAHNDINPTAEWQTEIEAALATCDLLVALIHPDFVKSAWCDQEIGYALGRGVPVFTVRCGADPHGFVGRFQAFNGNGKEPIIIAEELFAAAISHKILQAKMADVLVNLFINSGSFKSAANRVGYLEKLAVWDASYSARLKKAVEDNFQIGASYGVPERIKALLKKWKNAVA